MSVSSSHHIQDCSSVPHDGGVVELISEECILLILSFLFENLSSHLLGFTFPPPTHHSALMISERFFFLPLGYDQRVFWGEGWAAGYLLRASAYMFIIYVHIWAWSGVTSTWVLQKALAPTPEVVLQGCLQVWFCLSCCPAWGLALCLTWVRMGFCK